MEDRVSRIDNWTKVKTKLLSKESAAVSIWCEQNFGKRWSAIPYEDRSGVWTMFWRGEDREYEISFKYEEDAVRFLLKWGN